MIVLILVAAVMMLGLAGRAGAVSGEMIEKLRAEEVVDRKSTRLNSSHSV